MKLKVQEGVGRVEEVGEAKKEGGSHERTTTMGDSELVARERPFHIMRPGRDR